MQTRIVIGALSLVLFGAFQSVLAANDGVIAQMETAIAAQPGLSRAQRQILSSAVTDTLGPLKTLDPDKQRTAREQIKQELERVAQLAGLCTDEQFNVKANLFIWDLRIYASLPAVTPADREKDEQLRQIARQAITPYVSRAYANAPPGVQQSLATRSVAEFDKKVYVGSYFTYLFLYPPATLPSVEQFADRMSRKSRSDTATAYSRFIDRAGDQQDSSAAQKNFVESEGVQPCQLAQDVLGDLMSIPIRARMNLPQPPVGLLESRIKLQFELAAQLARQTQEAEQAKAASTTAPSTLPTSGP